MSPADSNSEPPSRPPTPSEPNPPDLAQTDDVQRGDSSPSGSGFEKLILGLVFFFLASGLGIFKVVNRDIGVHLVAGQVIAEDGLPDHNVFSEIHRDQEIVPHEWLFQWITYRIESAGGLGALSVARYFVILGLAFLFFSFAVKGPQSALVALVGGLGFFVAHERFLWRPDLFSLLFVALFVRLLIRLARRPSSTSESSPMAWRFWMGLVGLQVLWVNIHGYFIVGQILIACFFVGERLRGRKSESRQLMMGFGLVTLACFLNPHFHRGAFYPIVTLFDVFGEENIWGATIVEMLSPWSGPFADFWTYQVSLLLIGIFLIGLLLGKSKRTLSLGLAGFAAIAMYHTAFRNIGLLGVILGFVGAEALRDSARLQAWLAPRTVRQGLVGFTLVLSLGVFFFGVSNRYGLAQSTDRESGFGYVASRFHPRTRDFLEANSLDGPMFNNFGIGSTYLWWHYPQRFPFIIGYSEGYPHAFFEEAFLVTQGGIDFQEFAAKYEIEWVLLEIDKPLATSLFEDPDWAPVHLDSTATVLVKRLEKYDALIKANPLAQVLERAEFDWDRTPRSSTWYVQSPMQEIKLAKFVMGLGYLNQAKRLLDEAALINAESIWVWLARAQLALGQGDGGKAESYLRSALSIDGDSAEAYAMRAQLKAAQGDGRGALKAIGRATELAASNPAHWALQSVLYEQLSQVGAAIEAQRKVIDLQPRNFSAHQRLGQLCVQAGLRDEARKHLEESLRLSPHHAGADVIREQLESLKER